MNIQVIVPVVQVDLADMLFETMLRNTMHPTKVFIIDNTEKSYIPNRHVRKRLNAQIYVPKKRLGVNESWRLGFANTIDADIVTVLNDDIELNTYFFEKLEKVFQQSGVNIACPYTIVPINLSHALHRRGTPNEINFPKREANKIAILPTREGWAFSLRRSYLDSIPAIPNELKIFCGDDWFWFWSIKKGDKWVVMLDNIVFHHVGSTVKNIKYCGDSINDEKRKLLKILREKYKWNGYYPSKIIRRYDD